MLVRRATSIVVFFDGSRIVAHNFLSKDSFACNALCIDILAAAPTWRDAQFFFDYLSTFNSQSVAAQLSRLIENGGLIVEGTEAAEKDEEYARTWEWGISAGLYAFGIRDVRFLKPHEISSMVEARASIRPSPPLYRTNKEFTSVTELPLLKGRNGILKVMRKRRTRREFSEEAINIKDLAACLLAGLGITGFVEGPFGRLPLTMTPSGGARNPFEGYLYALRVQGLEKGIYHYSALEHSLGLVNTTALPDPQRMLAGQPWASKAAALVFLVADYDRTMWKYEHPNAYRVVLIEAGHIGQNIALAATASGLTAVPTCAFADSVVGKALLMTSLTQSVVYVLGIGSAISDPTPSHERLVSS